MSLKVMPAIRFVAVASTFTTVVSFLVGKEPPSGVAELMFFSVGWVALFEFFSGSSKLQDRK